MGSTRSHQGVGKAIAVALALAAVAAVVATAALGASSSSRLTIHVSPVARIGGSGSTLTIRGYVSCASSRIFALNVIALEPTAKGSAHGSLPLPGGKALMCKAPRKSFRVVATQQGEKKPLAIKSSKVRVCFIMHSGWKQTPLGLDAQCFTLRAAH